MFGEAHELDQENIKKFTKILAKGLKIDGIRKYLVQIKIIEVPLKVMENIASDAVYTECERMFVIDSRTVDNKHSINWKMTTKDFEKLTKTKVWV